MPHGDNYHLLAMFNHAVDYAHRQSLETAVGAARSEMQQQLYVYKRTHYLIWWKRMAFRARYTEAAHEDLLAACGKLVAAWRAYRAENIDRHIVPFTFKHRIRKFQKQTFYELAFNSDGSRRTNVFEQLCALNILGTCPHFEPSLIMLIAKYLLPSEEQHKVYYGYGWEHLPSIDLTYEQPTIDDKVCTKAELYAHNNPVNLEVWTV